MCLYYSPLLQILNKVKANMCKNCFEEYLKPWFVSMNDLMTFPTKFKNFPTRVSPYVQPNSIQVCFDSIVKPKYTSVEKEVLENKEIYSK